MIKIDFTFDTEYGMFSDAITLEDNHTYTNAEIDVMKQERLANWISIITAPSEEVVEALIEDIVE
jgi:hypothetical protein